MGTDVTADLRATVPMHKFGPACPANIATMDNRQSLQVSQFVVISILIPRSG